MLNALVNRAEQWWTRSQRIRTVAEIPVEIVLADTPIGPIYQRVAAKALQLRQLGMSKKAIARRLDVDPKTIRKAIAWLGQLTPAQ